MRYIVGRLAAAVPVLLVVAVVVFSLMYLTPGDPASVMLGSDATPQQVQQLHRELGLDRGYFAQLGSWLGSLVTGDLGTSPFLQEPVTGILRDHWGPTLSLALLAGLFALLLGVPAGIIAAHGRGSWTDRSFMGLTLLGISVPSFLLGMFLILVFGVGLRVLPVAGYHPPSDGLGLHLRYLLLPALALGSMHTALIARMTRSTMLDVMRSPYVKAARSRGVRERALLLKHSLKNASIPVLTIAGQTLGALVAGAAVIETVFGIPGIGQLVVHAVARRDVVVIQGVILLIAVAYVLINLIIDILYSVLDPRVRGTR